MTSSHHHDSAASPLSNLRLNLNNQGGGIAGMSDISSVNSPKEGYGGNPNQTPLRSKKLIPREVPSHGKKPSSHQNGNSVSVISMNKSIHTDYPKIVSPRPAQRGSSHPS
jgi:hypothetical protein